MTNKTGETGGIEEIDKQTEEGIFPGLGDNLNGLSASVKKSKNNRRQEEIKRAEDLRKKNGIKQ